MRQPSVAQTRKSFRNMMSAQALRVCGRQKAIEAAERKKHVQIFRFQHPPQGRKPLGGMLVEPSIQQFPRCPDNILFRNHYDPRPQPHSVQGMLLQLAPVLWKEAARQLLPDVLDWIGAWSKFGK